MKVTASWSRFGPSFYCIACGSRMNEESERTLIHPTHTKKLFTTQAIPCRFAGKKFNDPFSRIELVAVPAPVSAEKAEK